MKYVHYILVGEESLERHIEGLFHFEPLEVILLNTGENEKKLEEITQELEKREVPFSKKEFKGEKEDLFLAIVSSSANYLTRKDVFFAINKSVGSKEGLLILESAIQSPIGTSKMMGHDPLDKADRKALCYEVKKEEEGDLSQEGYDVDIVPFSEESRDIEKDIAQKAVPTSKTNPLLERIRWHWHVFPVKMRIWKNKFKKRLGLR